MDSQEIASDAGGAQADSGGISHVLSFHDLRIVGKEKKKTWCLTLSAKRPPAKKKKRNWCKPSTKKSRKKHPYYNCVITIDQNDS
jgi:hypothetical protein